MCPFAQGGSETPRGGPDPPPAPDKMTSKSCKSVDFLDRTKNNNAQNDVCVPCLPQRCDRSC